MGEVGRARLEGGIGEPEEEPGEEGERAEAALIGERELERSDFALVVILQG